MNRYIDIHSHILPGVDDGAKDMDETARMLRCAYDQGIRTICATPHYRPERWNIDASVIEQTAKEVQQLAHQIDPEFEIQLGNEIYYREECSQALESGKCHRMAGGRYILVEFRPGKDYYTISRALYRLLSEGYAPILAHIERYDCLKKDVGKIDDLIEQGVYMQVNAGSIAGDLGFATANFAKKLLKYQRVHFIATDCHNDSSRAPKLEKCASYITRKYGGDYTNELLYENPLKVIKNEYI